MKKYVIIILLMLSQLCHSELNGRPEPKAFPEVSFEIQSAAGFYSEKEIEITVNSNMLGLRNIYYKYLDRGLRFEGDVLLKFTITENGKVSNIDILSSTTGKSEFDEAIKNKVADWKLETVRINKVTSITLLFKFATIFTNRLGFISIDSNRPINEFVLNMNIRGASLQNIFHKFYKFKPGFSGKIILKYTVAGNGEFTKVDIVASTTEFPEFDEAIKNNVATWIWKSKENYSNSATFMKEFIF